MSVISDIIQLRQTVHSAFEGDSEKDELVYVKMFEELKNMGGDFQKNSQLIVEFVKQKLSGKPMDDRTMIVGFVQLEALAFC